MKLYNQNDLNELLKRTKLFFILFVIFISLSAVSLACFIIFSIFEYRTLFEVIGSVVTLLFTCLSIYYLDKSTFFKRIATEYLNIFNENGVIKEVIVTEVKEKPITLSDKSNVYEITCLIDKKAKVLYLSSIFENNFKIDKKYKILISFNYIKEYYEEA